MSALPTQENLPERKSSGRLVEFSKIRDLIKREKNLVQPHDSSIEPHPNDYINDDFIHSNKFSTPVKTTKNYLMTPENQRICVISEDVELEKLKKKFFTSPKRQGDQYLNGERNRETSQTRYSYNIEELEDQWSRIKKQHNFDTRCSSVTKDSQSFSKLSPRRNGFELRSFQERRQASCEQRKLNQERENQTISLLPKGVRQATIDLSSEVSLSKVLPKSQVRRETLPASLDKFDQQTKKKSPLLSKNTLSQELPKVAERQSRSKAKVQDQRKQGIITNSSEKEEKISKETIISSESNSINERVDSVISLKNEDYNTQYLLSNESYNNFNIDSKPSSIKALVTPLKSRASVRVEDGASGCFYVPTNIANLGDATPNTMPNHYIEKKANATLKVKDKQKNLKAKKENEEIKPKTRKIETSPNRQTAATYKKNNACVSPRKEDQYSLFSSSLVTYLPKGYLSKNLSQQEEDIKTKGTDKMQTLLRSIKRNKNNVPDISTSGCLVTFTPAELQTPTKIKSPQASSQIDRTLEMKKNKSHLKERKNKEDYSQDIEETEIGSPFRRPHEVSVKIPPVFETKPLISSTPQKPIFTSSLKLEMSGKVEDDQVKFEERASATLKKKVQEKVLKIAQTVQSPLKERDDKFSTPKGKSTKTVDSPNGIKIVNFEKAKLQRQKIMQSSFKPSKVGHSVIHDQNNLSLSQAMTPKIQNRVLASEKELKDKNKSSYLSASFQPPENKTKYWDNLKKKYVINLKLQV